MLHCNGHQNELYVGEIIFKNKQFAEKIVGIFRANQGRFIKDIGDTLLKPGLTSAKQIKSGSCGNNRMPDSDQGIHLKEGSN